MAVPDRPVQAVNINPFRIVHTGRRGLDGRRTRQKKFCSDLGRLIASYRWANHLMVRAAAAAAHPGAAAGQVDPTIDVSQAGDAMHGNRHIGQTRPAVGLRIVDYVMGKHTGLPNCRMFATKGMKATVDGDPVEPAARFRHWLFRRPFFWSLDRRPRAPR